MTNFRAGTVLDQAFAIGLGLKAIDGVGEVGGGLWLLFVNPKWLQAWAAIIFAPELREDPTDFVATHVLHWLAHFHESTIFFAAIYLLAHGFAKVVIVVEILRGRLWAYPGLIVLTLIFVAYQIYHMVTVSITVGFVALTLFDLLIIALTVGEYVKVRSRLAAVPQDLARLRH